MITCFKMLSEVIMIEGNGVGEVLYSIELPLPKYPPYKLFHRAWSPCTCDTFGHLILSSCKDSVSEQDAVEIGLVLAPLRATTAIVALVGEAGCVAILPMSSFVSGPLIGAV